MAGFLGKGWAGAGAMAVVLCLLGASAAQAVNPQDWMKKTKQRKVRRVSSKQTMVAAVRGVEEPGDVDPEARDFPGLEKVEKRSFAAEKLAQFMSEGKLAPRSGREQK